MTRDQLVRLRLYNQRLNRPSFTNPADVVRWFGAVQSQDFAGSLYAIGLRMRHATEALVEHAFMDRSIVRSWPMRRTLHCMVAEDARWMIRLLAPRGIDRMKPYHRALGITDDQLHRAAEVLEKSLAGDKQLTRAELYAQLNAAGIRTQIHGMHLLTHWAQAGLICIAARRENQPTFALLEDWTPSGRDLSGGDALVELARMYFRSHGPATVKDFAWWSSLPMAEAKRALLLAADLLKSTPVDSIEYWQMRNTPAPSAGPSPILLLPPFDEYTVAYADRTAAADASLLPSIGHGLAPNILVNGRIAGTWKRTLLPGGDAVVLAPTLLRILNRKEQAGLAATAERYAEFIGRRLAGETRSPRALKRRAPKHR
jgi:DNA glycosylase AlkZ-like